MSKTLLGVTCLAALAAAGCNANRPANEIEAQGGRMRATYDPETARLQQLTYDTNQDGKVDVRAFMDGGRLVRAEADENGDGATDRWEYYTTGAAPAGARPAPRPSVLPWASAVVERIEIAKRHDGKVSRREFYTQGVLARAEEDTDGDGKVDKWETYVNGVLSTIAFDLHHRGVPDRRLVYGADGTPSGLEVDAKGDGHFRPMGTAPARGADQRPVANQQ